MKQRSLWKGLLAILGTGVLVSILFRILFSFDEKEHAARGFVQSPAFQGHMMRGGGHGEFHHGFAFMPVLFLLIAVAAAAFFYARYRIKRAQFGSEAVFTEAPYTPAAVYSQADFLDEWEKQTQLEEQNNGNSKKD